MNHELPSGPDCAVWAQLRAAVPVALAHTTRALFAADSQRFEHCSLQAAGLLFDYSRQRVTPEVLAHFATLAEQLRLRERIEAMFRGDAINTTEGRAVLHTALRRPESAAPLMVGAQNIDALVRAERAHMLEFAEAVRNGQVRSSTSEQFSLVINIGIGGSDLGPAMAVEALRQYALGAHQRVDVLRTDHQRRGRFRTAQCGMQHRSAFSRVDGVAAKHRFDALPQA